LNLNDPSAFVDNQGSHVRTSFLADHSQDPRRYAPTVPLWHKNWLSTTPLTATIYQLSSQMRPHRILDIGCGNKPFRAVFSETSFYWGIDIVEGPSRSADIVGDVCVLPFASRVFDTVLCFQVMEHLARPAEMLAEAFRVLEPGGGYVVIGPNDLATS